MAQHPSLYLNILSSKSHNYNIYMKIYQEMHAWC
jgi:hypothetical protein